MGHNSNTIDYNSAPVKDNCALFAPIPIFSGPGYLTLSFKFLSWRPLLPRQRILGLCKRHLLDFCVYSGVFGDRPSKFSPSDPRCHGNEIWDKVGYNSAYVRNICKIFASIGRFSGICHRMMPREFFFRATLVAMTTKFETYWVVRTRLT